MMNGQENIKVNIIS